MKHCLRLFISGYSISNCYACFRYFTGTAWKKRVPKDETFDVLMSNAQYDAACRNIYQKHLDEQILIAAECKGHYQQEGKPIQFLRQEIVKNTADIVHWRGAAPDSALTHIAVNTNTQKAIAAVTDEEYNS